MASNSTTHTTTTTTTVVRPRRLKKTAKPSGPLITPPTNEEEQVMMNGDNESQFKANNSQFKFRVVDATRWKRQSELNHNNNNNNSETTITTTETSEVHGTSSERESPSVSSTTTSPSEKITTRSQKKRKSPKQKSSRKRRKVSSEDEDDDYYEENDKSSEFDFYEEESYDAFPQRSTRSKTRTRGTNSFGFENVGNTCYMSAVLTTLFHLKSFVHDLNNSTLYDKMVQWLQNNNGGMDSVYICLVKIFTIFKDNSQNKPTNPKEFKEVVNQVTKMFEGNAQEDAHEFLVACLMCIQEEIEKMSHMTLVDPVTTNFGVTVRLRDTCCTCKQMREKVEFFPVLTLHFPDRNVAEESNNNSKKRSLPPPNAVQDLFDNWFRPEIIDDFKCWHCLQKSQVLRSKEVVSLPKIFCVHLNRFAQIDNLSGIRKTAQRVSFSNLLDPSKNCANDVRLTMNFSSSHMDEILNTGTTSHHGNDEHKRDNRCFEREEYVNISDDQIILQNIDSIPKYELKGMINHKGRSRQRGHYFSILKNEKIGSWLEYDDQSVHVYTHDEVMGSSSVQSTCYLLFFEMVTNSDITTTQSTSSSSSSSRVPIEEDHDDDVIILS